MTPLSVSLCSVRGSLPYPSLAPIEEETVLSVNVTFGFEKVNSVETDGPLSDELAHGPGAGRRLKRGARPGA